MRTGTGATPRYQPTNGPVLFRQGFRPFFLGASLWALAVGVLWLPVFQGYVSLPTAFDPVAWHAHELLFGFVVATIAGFLLTAIPNWTGSMPLQGLSLAMLSATWVLGRLAVSFSDLIDVDLAAILDLSFLAALLAVVLREIVTGRNWRNLPMPVALTILLTANFLIHLDVTGRAATGALGQRLAIATIVLLISLIGGRIIPSFTRNWLKKQGADSLPASFGRFDRFCLLVVVVALVAWIAVADGPAVGAGLITAGLASLVRLARWQGHLTLSEPLVWSLHLGFAWLPLGLILLGFGMILPSLPFTAGLHALTAGAMGMMTLAVMTRAALGHSGRGLSADRWTAAIYGFVAAAAATRIAATVLPELYIPLLWAAALSWSAAFGLFIRRFGPVLLFR